MKAPWRHLPFALVLFLVLFIGWIDLALGLDWRVSITLLAPLLWLGLYLLGAVPEDTPRDATQGR